MKVDEVDNGSLLKKILDGEEIILSSPIELLGDKTDMLSDDETSDEETENSDDEFAVDDVLNPRILKLVSNFNETRNIMEILDSGIYKMVNIQGSGVCPPAEDCRLTIHITGYVEGANTYFENTYTGCKPKQVTNYSMMPGVILALQTMQPGELSYFIIPSVLMFGPNGHETNPTIPPNADLFYIIKLISFEVIGNIDDLDNDNLTNYEAVKRNVDNALLHAKSLHQKGMYRKSIDIYKRCVTRLQKVGAKNDEEDNERKTVLVKLYTNLANCYLLIDQFRTVCSMCNDIQRIQDYNEIGVKVHYYKGKALLKMGLYSDSLKCLKKALKLEPKNVAIINLINEAVQRQADNNKFRAEMATKYFESLKK